MIDPNIIMRGAERAQLQQQQNIESLGDLGGALGKLIYGRRVNQMQQLKSPEEQQAFANNSIYAPYLNKQLKADAAAKVKAEQDALKFKSDLNNTDAQAAERLANAGSTNQKTGASRHGATLDVWRAAATNPSYGKVMLNNLLNAGAITQDVFDGTNNQLSVLEGASPAQAKQIIGNQIQAMLDPKYEYPDANTVANNETSIKTTGMNNATTMRGQDITATTAANKLEQDGKQFSQEQKLAEWVAKNKPIDEFTAEDGTRYHVYPGGKGIAVSGSDNQPIKVQQKQIKLSDSALKQVNDYNTQLTQSKANQLKIGGLIKDLQSGKLDLSPTAVIAAEGRARLGLSTPNDLAIGRFNTTLNQSVNDILMSAKGTQTEGDAQRAAKIITANPPRDNKSAMQALQNLALIAKTNITGLDNNLNTIYANFGMERPQAQSVKPTSTNTEQTTASHKGATVSLAKVNQLAQKAGISTEEAVRRFQSQGLVVK